MSEEQKALYYRQTVSSWTVLTANMLSATPCLGRHVHNLLLKLQLLLSRLGSASRGLQQGCHPVTILTQSSPYQSPQSEETIKP